MPKIPKPRRPKVWQSFDDSVEYARPDSTGLWYLDFTGCRLEVRRHPEGYLYFPADTYAEKETKVEDTPENPGGKPWYKIQITIDV